MNHKDISIDDQILDLIQRDNEIERGFRLFVRTHQKPLYRMISRMVRSHQDTDDIIQNVFIKVYRHIGGFKRNSALSTWLYRIAMNETYSFLNRRTKINKKRSELKTELAAVDISDPIIDDVYIEKKLQEAINTLPVKQKMIFNLRYYEDIPYAEMSSTLGTSTGALKASYHHAVKKIEKYVLKQEVL